MKQKELKTLIENALNNSRHGVKVLSGNDNPQIIELRKKCEGEVSAFEAVLDALNNNRVSLKIMAGS